MITWLIALFGFKIVYVCEWGTFESRYDSIDRHMGRPCHEDMKVAPPWARMKIIRK